MRIIQLIKKITPQKLIEWRRLRDSKEYRVIQNPDTVFRNVYHIKDSSWEEVTKPAVFNISKSTKISLYHPEQKILEINRAIVRDRADYVLVDDECVWDKSYQDIFSITIPWDRGLMTYSREKMRIRKIKDIQKVDGDVISLLGVHAQIWSHFLMQFLCKLYYAEEAKLLDRPITLILPVYNDANITELVEDILSRHKKYIKTIIAKDDCGYFCDRLYYIETTSIVSNHGEFIIPYLEVVPARVREKLYSNIVLPRLANIKNSTINKKTYSKIYLVRRDTYRKLENYGEVESFFVSRGFVLLEPHKLTLMEKAEIFNAANVIVGPMSSAWSNVIFCRADTKALCFSPICRTEELFIGYHADISNIDLTFVTGDDLSTSIHPNYYISLERIETAYQQLMNEEK